MIGKIKQAIVSALKGDTRRYPTTTASYKGKQTDVVRHSVYGLSSHPPVNSMGILLKVDGIDGLHYGIFDYASQRFKNLESGEVQLGNYVTATSIKFDKDGNVTIEAGSGDVTINCGNAVVNASDVDINATLTTIDGDLDVTGDITFKKDTVDETSLSDFRNTYNTHVHLENGAGNNTNTPNPTI